VIVRLRFPADDNPDYAKERVIELDTGSDDAPSGLNSTYWVQFAESQPAAVQVEVDSVHRVIETFEQTVVDGLPVSFGRLVYEFDCHVVVRGPGQGIRTIRAPQRLAVPTPKRRR